MNNRSLEVLLVEDNVADVDLVREAFKQSKVIISLHVVDRGETALAYLNCEKEFVGAPRPDLVLLDLNLPGIDGREVLHFIKTSETLKSIPVVILTSSAADLDILKTYSWGANAYVVKPVGFPNFLKAISTIEDFWLDLVKLPTRELVLRYQLNRSGTEPRSVVSAGSSDEFRTLVVEDNDADADLILETLKKSTHPKFTTERVVRLSEAHERLKQGHIDLILLDLSLPDSNGFETITSIQQAFPFLPIVIMTGLDDPDMGVKAVKEGAQDFIVKGQMNDILIPRVLRYAVERKNNETVQMELHAAEREARLRADKATAVRDEFLAIAAHELKTPLTGLRMQIQLLQRLCMSPSDGDISGQKSQLESLLKNLDHDIGRFGGLINILLDLSRIQAGRLSLEKSEFDLVEMVKGVIARVGPNMTEANCPVHLNAEVGMIGQWDRFRLEQIIVNLLTNAAKYAKGKPIDIRVSGDENNSEIEVQDYGPGISTENQERIFGRFERAVKGQSIMGLGLGLYISRQIVDAHGGTISVKSELGKGSTFTVRLPRRVLPVGSLDVVRGLRTEASPRTEQSEKKSRA